MKNYCIPRINDLCTADSDHSRDQQQDGELNNNFKNLSF